VTSISGFITARREVT